MLRFFLLRSFFDCGDCFGDFFGQLFADETIALGDRLGVLVIDERLEELELVLSTSLSDSLSEITGLSSDKGDCTFKCMGLLHSTPFGSANVASPLPHRELSKLDKVDDPLDFLFFCRLASGRFIFEGEHGKQEESVEEVSFS